MPEDLGAVFLSLIGSPNIASKRWVFRQYDHMVRTDTVVSPGSDAAVVRIKGTNKAIALTTDCNSRYCYLDPFTGGQIAVAEAARNISVSGAEPIAVTDCLNFGNPERPEVMWQFSEAIRGISTACEALGIPVVSGNVSFYNETSGESIYPTPTIGMVGLIEDLSCHTTQWFKDPGDLIVLLGESTEEIGASEYLKVIHSLDRGRAPQVDLIKEKNVDETCLEGIKAGIIKSAHDLSEGGLAVALAEACLAPESPLGAEVSVDPEGMRADALLFGEGQARILVSIAPDDVALLKRAAQARGVPVEVLGTVGGDRLKVGGFIDLGLSTIRARWDKALEEAVA